jgi:hypothetical protein
VLEVVQSLQLQHACQVFNLDLNQFKLKNLLHSLNEGLGIVSLPSIYTQVSSYASSGLIDPVSNLKDDKVYIYHGLLDVVVSAGGLFLPDKTIMMFKYFKTINYLVPAKKNEDFYNNYMPASQIKTVYTVPSVHGIKNFVLKLTDFQSV